MTGYKLIFFFTLVCVVSFVNPALSSGQTQGLLSYLLSTINIHDVVILGEIHRHNESEELAYKIAENRIKSGKPLTVALEIDSDQNHFIENCNIDKIKLPQVIDSPDYRDFLSNLSRLQKSTDLLRVKAIDLALDKLGKRDPWMAEQIMSLLEQGYGPILVLVGNNHAIKHVVWTQNTHETFLAEILLLNKIDTMVIMQDWVDDNCEGGLQGNLYFPESQEARETINKFLSCMNVNEDAMPAENVTDAIIRWECK